MAQGVVREKARLKLLNKLIIKLISTHSINVRMFCEYFYRKFSDKGIAYSTR